MTLPAELDRDSENQIMQILKKTTVFIDVDSICGALGSASYNREAVNEFLRKWHNSVTQGNTLDGKAGFKWK